MAAVDGAGPAVRVGDLVFGYDPARPVLDVPHFEVQQGERVFLYGPSGSGKTTLLGVLAGVLRADRGSVELLGTNLSVLGGAARDRFRAVHVGYVFQMFNLIPYLSVLENVALPCRLSAARRARLGGGGVEAEAQRLLDRLGMAQESHWPVTDLSVGQQQRVAAARALIGAPEIVIADEPTSALDAARRTDFLRLLFASCEEAGAALLFVSHDERLGELFERQASLPELNRAAAARVSASAA